MRVKIGILGSADDTLPDGIHETLFEIGTALGRAIAARECLVLTGATTGLPYVVAKAAHDARAFHIGVSPAASVEEHATHYQLPTDACDALIYTGFGLKGRNVVLVRSCDIALFIGGSMGSLNEFTIAHDEGRIIGCLRGTGGVADEAARLLRALPKKSSARILYEEDAERLVDECLKAFEQSRA